MFQASTRTVDFHNIIFLVLYDFVIIVENRWYSARTPLLSWTIWHEFVVIFHNQKQIRRVCVRFVNTMAIWVVKFSRYSYVPNKQVGSISGCNVSANRVHSFIWHLREGIQTQVGRFLAKNQQTQRKILYFVK